jgi:beta-galactosidase/beta-glucuronidase
MPDERKDQPALDLNGVWKFNHTACPTREFRQAAFAMAAGWSWLNGEVPGDLAASRPDEHVYCVRYFKVVEAAELSGELVCEGLGRPADVFLNGELLGRTQDPKAECRFWTRGLRPGDNELFLHLYPAAVPGLLKAVRLEWPKKP